MNNHVDLILLSQSPNQVQWPLGKVHFVETIDDINCSIKKSIKKDPLDAILFWQDSLELPNPEQIQNYLKEPMDVWHAGLLMGMQGEPESMNMVLPTWMLNLDCDPLIRSTSWRLSLKACLVRGGVLQQLGELVSNFESIEGASLELGYRWITKGVRICHEPSLLTRASKKEKISISLEDQLRFIHQSFSKKWFIWVLFRYLMTCKINIFQIVHFYSLMKEKKSKITAIYSYAFDTHQWKPTNEKVSVLIPTLKRYPYLENILAQFRNQVFKPHEIIVVDQTPQNQRDQELIKDFSDLPIKWIFLDSPGQCSARNAGLKEVEGDFILFLDDDDTITNNLIETHLKSLNYFKCDISSGVAEEEGAGPLPENFTFSRISDVFPTNNTLIRKEILQKSGGFDLAFDRRSRADEDLGTRLHLSGSFMILNPAIAVEHKHADVGGLREHRARVHTFASSRKEFFSFHLPSASEIYLAKRYYTDQQVQEMLWMRVFGTFSFRGNKIRKFFRIIISFVSLIPILLIVKTSIKTARCMMKSYPNIPKIETLYAKED